MALELFVRSFDGTNLFVKSEGAGIPIVFNDGIGCDGYALPYIREALLKRYRLIEWHYRGHGESQMPADPEAVRVDDVIKDLSVVLEALKLERTVLMGYSMGVQIALDYAIRNPAQTLGLVLLCGSYGRPLDHLHNTKLAALAFPYLRKAVERFPDWAQRIWTTGLRSELAYQFAVNVEVEGRRIKRTDLKPYFEHLSRMDTRLFIRMLDDLQAHSVEARLHEITAPTLIVAGEHDSFTPVWLSKRMQRRIADSELLVVPWGTHGTPLEMPELVCLRLLRFLDERVSVLMQSDTKADLSAGGVLRS